MITVKIITILPNTTQTYSWALRMWGKGKKARKIDKWKDSQYVRKGSLA